MARLTESQERAATTFDRHLVVTAGAGAGKTRVLIARILGLLAEGKAELEQVVALTFTNKAAAEMKLRLRQALLERAAAEGPEDRVWERRLRDLDQARITTIHSFCGQLLREYPIEAGVDPQFAVLEEQEAQLRLRSALQEALLALTEEGDEGVSLLLGHYPRTALLQELAGVYGRLREYGQDPVRLREDTLHTLEETRRLLPEAALVVEQAVADMQTALRQKAGGRSHDRAAEQLAALAARWETGRQALEQLVAGASTAPDDGAADPTSGPDPAALLDDLRPVGKVVGRQNRSLIAEIDALQGALLVLEDAVWGVFLGPAALAAGRILENAHALYQARKRAGGALDFSDLQLLSRDLLRRPEVAGDLRSRFPYLMVDEYQDTNPLQSELIALWEPRNLFVVGDPKQSIYRFRGAEVELFRRARREIPAAGGEEVSLAENFRSEEGIIHFINHVFSRVMGEEYEAFLPGRQSPPATAPEPRMAPATAADTATDATGAPAPVRSVVEVLLPREMENEDGGRTGGQAGEGGSGGGGGASSRAKKPSRREDLELEAAAVAERIHRMVDGSEPLVGEGEKRPVQYGDVAILLRATRVFGEYERALRERGIPFQVVSGRGFYAKQEVRDCLNLLRALDNPEDEISLVGALRSPFFGLSDETLFWLSQNRSALPWPETLASPPPELDPEQRDLTLRAATLWRRFRLLEPRLSVSELVERVLQETDYTLVALGGRGGEQAAANLDKLLGLARRFQQSGASRLRDFLALMEDFEVREVREGEAAIQAGDGNTVRIMSVHQSKGLEFPVVFVADLAHQARGISGILYRPGLGLGLAALSADGDRVPTRARRLLEEEERRLEREEDTRVFYVAATRARDCLVLAGTRARINTARDYPEMTSWLEWLCRALGITDTAARSVGGAGGQPVLLPVDLPPDAGVPAEQVRVVLPGDVREWLARAPRLPEGAFAASDPARGAAEAPQAAPLVPPDLLEDADPTGGRTFSWSVTDLMTYERCPRRFALQRRLGLPETAPVGAARPAPGGAGGPGTQGAERPEAAGSGAVRLDALTRGNLVHRVLERLRQPEEMEDLLKRAAREAGLGEDQQRAAKRELRPLLERYLAGEVFRTIAGGHSQAERAFQYRLADSPVAVSGVIDNLLTAADGRTLVIDFKTNEVPADRVPALAEEYRLQVELYALVAARLFGIPVAECWLYFLKPDVCHRISIPEGSLDQVEARLARLAGEMSGGRSLKDYPARVGDHCLTCPQRAFCQASGVLADYREVS